MVLSIPAQGYRIGLAKVDVTPPLGIWLAGFANRLEPAKSVNLPLRAVAMEVDDGLTPVLLVSVEWLGFYEHTEPLRQRLSQAIGMPPAQIILHGTHTHFGPALRAIDLARHGSVDTDYLARACDAMVACASQAWQERRPAILQVGRGHCDIAASRRRLCPTTPSCGS